jgi:putative spermidine/putrescine transport system ATP-binding protein
MRGIRVDAISKSFGATKVLHDVSFALADGEFLTLLGASGSGKSTTLGIIAGFIAPSSGEVWIAGRSMRDAPARQRNLGIVFQNYALFPNMTVFDNVAFGLRARGVAAAERRGRVGAMLQRLGIDHLQHRRPAQLSGGQQQRVALARALSIDPVALLLDEPLGALDRQLRQSVQTELKALQRASGVSVLYVTHDQEEAMVLSDRVAIMRHGRIAQIGPPAEIYRYPRDVFVAEFVGEANLIDVGVASLAVDHAGIVYPDGSAGVVNCAPGDGRPPGPRALVCLRPERIRFGPATDSENAATATVLASLHAGPTIRYRLHCFGREIVATVPDGEPPGQLEPGSRVALNWPRRNAHLIAGES